MLKNKKKNTRTYVLHKIIRNNIKILIVKINSTTINNGNVRSNLITLDTNHFSNSYWTIDSRY